VLLSENQAGKLTILVVEDEWLVRLPIVEFLVGAECEVIEAATGEEAVAMLRQRDGFDAVVTDIQLGGSVDGWDVGEVSRETHPNIPVVYTSGAAMIPERCVAGSIFLQKPYDPAVVLNACQTFSEAR
jgi:CheY-like chemotaxis protein